MTAILVVGGIVAALYFARDVLVPIALAVLLSFVLAPLVRRLQSWRASTGSRASSLWRVDSFEPDLNVANR